MRVCAWATAKGLEDARCWGWGACARGGCSKKDEAAARRKREGSSYRKFPGRPRQFAGLPRPYGVCSWCEGAIMDPKKPGEVNRRRGWHDGRLGEPDCLFEYYVHTRQPEALAFLVGRDGPGCAHCGEFAGRWSWRPKRRVNELWLRWFDPQEAQDVDGPDGPMCAVTWSSSLQVDHRLALAIVALTIPEAERWVYWGPMNLQGLCHPCHVAKTRQDVIDLKATRARLDAEARSGDVAPLTDDSDRVARLGPPPTPGADDP